MYNLRACYQPVIHDVTSPSSLNASIDAFYKIIVKEDMDGKSLELITTVTNSWVDVRDLAEAHALALAKADAGGERFIMAEGLSVTSTDKLF